MEIIYFFALFLLIQQSSAYFKCPEGSVDEFYRDPEDCSKFHRCYENSRHATFSCSPGTFFNELIVSCDHAYKVKCDVDKYGAGSGPHSATVRPPIDDSNVRVDDHNSDLDPLLGWRNKPPNPRPGVHNYSSPVQGSEQRSAQYRQAQSTVIWTPPKSGSQSQTGYQPSQSQAIQSKSDPYDYQRKETVQRYNPRDYPQRQYTQSPQYWTTPRSQVIWRAPPTPQSRTDSRDGYQQKEPQQKYNPGDYSRDRQPDSRSGNRYPPYNQPNYDYNQERQPSGSDQSKQGYTQKYQYPYYYTKAPDSRYQPSGYTQPTYRYQEPESDRRYQRPDSRQDSQRPQTGNQYPDSGDYQRKENPTPLSHGKDYDGSDNQFPSGSQTKYDGDKRPSYDSGDKRPDYGSQDKRPQYGTLETKRPQYGTLETKRPDYGSQDKRPDYGAQDKRPDYGAKERQQQYSDRERRPETIDKRPDYDSRRYPDQPNRNYDQQQTVKPYLDRKQPPSDSQVKQPRKDDTNRDFYNYGDPFEIVTKPSYSQNQQESRRDPYGRDWSQREPLTQTRRPYEPRYDGREPRREKEFDDWFTTKDYSSVQPDLSNLQNLSRSNYDTLYQLCLRLYPQETTTPDPYFRRGDDRQSQVRPDRKQMCEQFNPSRTKYDSNRLPDVPHNWPQFATPSSIKRQTESYDPYARDQRKSESQSQVDVEPESRKNQLNKPNYDYDRDYDRNRYTTQAPWRVPRYTPRYQRSDRENYEPKSQPNIGKSSDQRDSRDQQYTKAPFKPPYQRHDPIDSQRKIDEWPTYNRHGDLYASSSNRVPRYPKENDTNDISNLLPNDDPFAIQNLISNVRCEDAVLQDCTDCETLSYLKFPKVYLRSPFLESYTLYAQTVEKDCFQICLEKNCIAYSFNTNTGNCSIYHSDVSGDQVGIDKDYSTVIVEPKLAILKEEWLVTSPAAPAGKPMAVISQDNAINCLQMCYQIGEQCEAIGYDYTTKICKFYDAFNGKKVALKSNTIAIQHKNISELDDQWGADPHSWVRPERQHICVKFNPSRRTQEKNQMGGFSPQSLRLVDDPKERNASQIERLEDIQKEPLREHRRPYLYTERNPFQIITDIPEYGYTQPSHETDRYQTTQRPGHEGRQPRRENEFDEFFPTQKPTLKPSRVNDTLYHFCLQLYAQQQQTTPSYGDRIQQPGNYQQSVVKPDKLALCEQFNPNRRQQDKQRQESAPQKQILNTESSVEYITGHFEVYPNTPFKPMGHESNVGYPERTTTEKPTEKPIKTWWSWDDDVEKAGRCGVGAPKINGVYPTCNPDSRSSYCCGYTGYCGSGKAFCDCPLCVNFKTNPTFRW